MVAVVGLLVVLGAVVFGYLMAGGHLAVLFQPAELIIIGGAALGALLTGTPPRVVKALLGQLGGIAGRGPSKADYASLLTMLYELLNLARREGMIALEPHVEDPKRSAILGKHRAFLAHHGAVDFLVDTLRLLVGGASVEAHDLEALMDADLEAHHREEMAPSRVLMTIGDALPGLGIVAAVLGIVITMGAIDGPPEEIGHKVGAALVGTFLGILLSYGFMQPLAQNFAAKVEERGQYVVAIKHVLLAFHKGCHPAVAVEFARRALPDAVRPGFTALEEACRSTKAAAA